MDLVAVIRHKVMADGQSIRDVSKELNVSRNTVRRYLRGAIGGERAKTTATVSTDKLALQRACEDLWRERRSFTAGKQQFTAQRMTELLRERGHEVSDRTVRRMVARFKSAEREVTIPLVHHPGDLAQVDFFEVFVDVQGTRTKAFLFLMRLLASGRDFVMLCERQDTTWFLAAHVAAFAFFRGVIAAIAYDNLTAAVAKVLLGEPRVLRPRFAQLVSHYAFEARFCRVGVGHDKGAVERRGGNLRLQHLVPIPSGASLEEISATLQASITAKFDAHENKTQLWQIEQRTLHALPLVPLDPAEVWFSKLRHHSAHKIKGAWYSVPSHWCGEQIEVREGTKTVRLVRGNESVEHPRVAFGEKSIRYEHLLGPLSIKPQAVRQVIRELIAQFGAPWDELWKRLSALHAADEIEAARRFAHWLHEAHTHGLERAAVAVRRALAGELAMPEKRSKNISTKREDLVPERLRGIDVETPDLSRYDALAQEVA
ncbi:MAG: IS21 family transposase [Polyangiales bacterium]